MLILHRKPGEGITVTVAPSQWPQVIRLDVLAANFGGARLGFTADDEVNIVRSELVKAEKEPSE